MNINLCKIIVIPWSRHELIGAFVIKVHLCVGVWRCLCILRRLSFISRVAIGLFIICKHLYTACCNKPGGLRLFLGGLVQILVVCVQVDSQGKSTMMPNLDSLSINVIFSTWFEQFDCSIKLLLKIDQFSICFQNFSVKHLYSKNTKRNKYIPMSYNYNRVVCQVFDEMSSHWFVKKIDVC